MIVDLHTHSTLSDGVLIPAESVRRAVIAGYSGIVITDHADFSNFSHILESVHNFKNKNNTCEDGIKILAGVELTHVRPCHIAELTASARAQNADLVLVHGESLAEPVEEGTNRAAIDAGVDILAHPGLISYEDALLAAKNGVYLELTTRKGHSLTNGHVAKMALSVGAKLVICNDFHAPGDYVEENKVLRILEGAGLSSNEALLVLENNIQLFKSKL